jgi:hypothetical protein
MTNQTRVINSIFILVFIAGCAKISNPEKSGGEILAVTESCEFSISENGNWLQYAGDESPQLKPDAKNPSRQRETFLLDLETGESFFAEPDSNVKIRIAEGLGPDGLGCFSPNNSKLFFTTADWSNFAGRERNMGDNQYNSQQSPALSVPGRQITRYHYEIDLTNKPFIIRETDTITCTESQDPVKPDIRVQRPSNKVVDLYSNDGRQLSRHRPRGWFNTIFIWDLDSNQWEMSYSLSPDGNYLAYRISESGMIGFSAPTRGYMVNLSPGANQTSRFLAASVFSLEWGINGNLYACTSHSQHRRVIARWSP